jgi:alanyl aminopeptidase
LAQWRLALIAGVAQLLACSAAAQSTPGTAPPLQLPPGIAPLSYQLDLTVFPERSSFDGRVRIDIRFDSPTDGFWIHGRDLHVDSVTLNSDRAAPIAATYRQLTPDGTAWIHLARPIEAGIARLDISYRGEIGESLEGLFHVAVNGVWYAFTQLEPVDARAVFPCLTSRAKRRSRCRSRAKAPPRTRPLPKSWRCLTVPSGCASNRRPAADVSRCVHGRAARRRRRAAAGKGRCGVGALRGLAVEGRGPRFDYALAHTPAFVAPRAVLRDAVPFSKLDLLAIPSQQSAMENAALITYGEYSVLLGPTASLAQQRGYAYIHAHELAHQWFGDSVTMRWWDDLWLNEAFATFLSFKIVQDWEPAYRAEENLVESSLAAMSADRFASARRIREPIETVDDIINAFDGITYSKGAGVLNMLDGYLGATTFRDGIRAYLKRHAGGSADMRPHCSAHAEFGSYRARWHHRTFTEQPGTRGSTCG